MSIALDPVTDSSWRVGAIYRCCVRYGKGQAWARDQLEKAFKRFEPVSRAHPRKAEQLAAIWFRGNRMEREREHWRGRVDESRST